ncbi:MAG: hypothetical protein IPL46_31635 [Saprospiraceae bacterium]|nr:hypothetical protein [Saprospiraceae bacterium]
MIIKTTVLKLIHSFLRGGIISSFSLIAVLFSLACSSKVDYSNIKKIETSYVSFGTNFPIRLDLDFLDHGLKAIITDSLRLVRIESILLGLSPSVQKIDVKENPVLKSIILFGDAKRDIVLITDGRKILVSDVLYEYSPELIGLLCD